MFFNYIILAVLAIVAISIYSGYKHHARRDLGFYWVLSLFLAIGFETLGYTEAAYFFAGTTFFLWFFGDRLKFK
jgi:hypothetical protein